uniref:Synaptopodin 2 n=1 Tax=Fundulus heteroclitus TaxID=8078 RepID=A0A3Q2TTL5_FUNHE
FVFFSPECVSYFKGCPRGVRCALSDGPFVLPVLLPLQVEDGSRACLAGVQEGDEVVSINGESCADLTLCRALALLETSVNSLQLLLKRLFTLYTLSEIYLCLFSQHIIFYVIFIAVLLLFFKRSNFIPSEDCVSEGTHLGERVSSGENLKSTTLHIISPNSKIPTNTEDPHRGNLSDDLGGHELVFKHDSEEVRRCFSPGEFVELQVSLSEQTLDDGGCTSLGSARGIEGDFSAIETAHTPPPHPVSCPNKEPLGQHGVVISAAPVEVPVQPPEESGTGRGALSVGGPTVTEDVGSQSEEKQKEGLCKPVPASFTISFEIPSDETALAEEHEDSDSDSEGDQEKPNKHRARHARLRRNESLSEKQVKEAKSKCKRIALLLSAAPSNPHNKGVLMFKKHRQRAKKYTLVSYGTGEDEPEFSDEEDEVNGDDKQEIPAGEFSFEATFNFEPNKHFLLNAPGGKGVLTFKLDKSLVENNNNLNDQAEMECLPETKGKGALMFAQRRQRMDEIAAEHEELRRQGLPVEAEQEMDKKVMEQCYMQSTPEGHQQMHHYSTNINGTIQPQTNENQSLYSNRTAKPFTAENVVATPYSHGASGTNQDSVGQGEQIASRDERISTPAIRTGLLSDSRRKNISKPMFTFKEAPKVSPNPALLNLLNRSDKKGFESGAEEDYLSLGAEACNFLQSQRLKPKIPPPVAPKPVINPNSPPWSAQMEATSLIVPMPTVNTQPSPKPWHSPQNQTPPPPPRRMLSYTVGQKAASPVNPLATVLNPKPSQGSAFEMPVVKGKGADMFAKRQSRMEKFVVDSETVEANKASRSASPAASLPNEWKYTPNVRAPPPRAYNPIQSPFYPLAATKQPPASSPLTKAKKKDQAKPAPKPLNVIDVMKHQPYKLDSSLFVFGPGAEAAKPPPPKPIPYKAQPASSYITPSFPLAARPESVTGGSTGAAPKPKFTANKSSAQVWKPTAIEKESYSLSPPARVPFAGQKSASTSSSPKPPTRASTNPPARQTSCLDRGFKPLTPWEAASRHPLGLVDEAFALQDLQQSLASNVHLAARRKILPEPPAEWKERAGYPAQQKPGSQAWSPGRHQGRAPIPSFFSPSGSPASSPVGLPGYRSLPRQWRPQKYAVGANQRASASSSARPTYMSAYTSSTLSWRR